MVADSEQETLVHVGPGTAMGVYLRLFWIPFLVSDDVEVDGPPKRIKLLGENLVAFRDSSGAVGLVQEACAHRQASLAFGRNEECGLRCVYHGWKYDLTGQCVDMPNEGPSSNFAKQIKITAYPCRERNGLIWTFMGLEANPPKLPNLESNLVPEGHRFYSARVQRCNWLQAIEGALDPSHGPFLHSKLSYEDDKVFRPADKIRQTNKQPVVSAIVNDSGVSVVSRREVAGDDANYYWRVNQFMFPFFTLVPPNQNFFVGHAWVPMDDEHTMVLTFTFDPIKEFREDQFAEWRHGAADGGDMLHLSAASRRADMEGAPYSWAWPKHNASNNYLIDWEAQKTTYFSGLPGAIMQDLALVESMGPIVDRRRDNLGAADLGIVRVRTALAKEAQKFAQEGIVPAAASNPDAVAIRSMALMLPRDSDFRVAFNKHSHERGDVSYAVP